MRYKKITWREKPLFGEKKKKRKEKNNKGKEENKTKKIKKVLCGTI